MLSGNDDANLLAGAEGGDTLSGRGGDDILIGGFGANTLDGGAGFDFASYEGIGPLDFSTGVPFGGVTVALSTGVRQTFNGGSGDILISIED